MIVNRRCLLTGGAVLAAVPGQIARAADSVEGARERWGERAAATLSAIRRAFAVTGGGPYREHYPARAGDGAHAHEWPFSQVHVGVLDYSCIPGVGQAARTALAEHRAMQEWYWQDRSANGLPGYASDVVPPHGQGGDLYYDDNDWVGLAMVQHWSFVRDATSLERAKSIYALVRSAWDNDPRHPHPGGLFWTQQRGNTDRNTVSNMPAAQLALRLHEITGERQYLDEALRYRAWTNDALQREDGLYLDHLDAQGNVDARIFTYNQGVPIGVNTLLFRITGEKSYLVEAQRIAAASDRHFVRGGRLERQSMPFNAIFFKNLLLMEAVAGGTAWRAVLRDYVDRVWARQRDPASGLFRHPTRSSHDPASFQLIDQGAMLQMLSVLAWDPADHARLY